MTEQPKGLTKNSQPKSWKKSELIRVARIFELLIKVDQRQKRGKLNDKDIQATGNSED